jgi:hypothetical protein
MAFAAPAGYEVVGLFKDKPARERSLIRRAAQGDGIGAAPRDRCRASARAGRAGGAAIVSSGVK